MKRSDSVDEVVCRNEDELADRLAEALGGRLSAAIEARGGALLAVSGGRSPAKFFRRLAQYPLAWERVTVTLVDERWVDESHPDSNAALVKTHLLQGPAERARFVPMKTDAPSPFDAVEACERRIGSLPLPFDVLVLGMGDDGHTASLFPGAEQLTDALDVTRPNLCVAVRPPTAPHERMSLTLRGVLSSRLLMLELYGQRKLEVYRRARAGGPVSEMPVRAVLQQSEVPLEVYYAGDAR